MIILLMRSLQEAGYHTPWLQSLGKILEQQSSSGKIRGLGLIHVGGQYRTNLSAKFPLLFSLVEVSER